VHAAAVLRYENDLKTVDRDLQKIENKVTADFSGVERDDFQYQMNRVAIVEKRRGTLLTDDEVQRYTRLTERRKQLAENRPTGIAQALCVKETAGELPPVFVLQRGNPASPAEQVQPGFPAVLSPPEPQLEASHNPATSGRRLALAKWITSPENPLTARVMVNRIWQYHFGRGLVRTSSDFGFQGQAPTHPELLDWLAAEFIARGWSVREMHRLIMNSAVYQFSSAGNPQALDQDPLNDAFWRVDMRRLSAESSSDVHRQRVAEPGRRSTMTSRMAPRVQRTIFTSACGSSWKCMPRRVPRTLFHEMLHCASVGSSPRSRRSSGVQHFAKNPRSSPISTRSMMNVPGSGVSVKVMG